MDTYGIVVNGQRIEYDALSTESEGLMADEEWGARVKGILKAELKRRNLSYRDLSEKLAALGIQENETNIKNKISRGGFSAVFFVQCLSAIGAQAVRLDG